MRLSPLLLLALGTTPALHAQPRSPALRSDPFAGRLVLTPTAHPHPAGTGHVSLRTAAYAIIPVLVGVQASVGLTDEVGASVTLMQAVARKPLLVATGKWTPVTRGGLSVAFGATAVAGGSDPDPYAYRQRQTLVDPFVAVTLASSPIGSGLSASLGPATWSIGADLRTAAHTHLVLEAARPGMTRRIDGGDVSENTVVSAAVRTYGRRYVFERGVSLVPSELDACKDSEAIICLPPIFPTLSIGRRLRF